METKLVKIRKESGFGIKDIASLLGVAASTVYSWENGSRKPSHKNMVILSKTLKKTADELFF